ncbi:hypothetical protein E1B28_000315 [Marasmius oreades]|uniref:Uncharacterized protein n=1 Tax=Marasmius oreades TaxID=181124 RepID=A0A9P7V168_9AGAR|nr:uncharacterized protein E1B28_000315 [Marasmius oreades]KAG7098357.1 hypothetical protein E1B28_000315 [Marasmius oreades]
MATSSLADFSFNFIGKEPDLLKRLSTPHPSHQYSQERDHPVSPSAPYSSHDDHRLGDGEPLSSGSVRPTLLQVLSGGDLDCGNDTSMMDMTSGTDEDPHSPLTDGLNAASNRSLLSNEGAAHPRDSSGSAALHHSSSPLPSGTPRIQPVPFNASSCEDRVTGHSASGASILSSQALSTAPIISPSSSAGTEEDDGPLTLQYPLPNHTGSYPVKLTEVNLEQVDPSDGSPPIPHHRTSLDAASSSTPSHHPHTQLSSSEPQQHTQSDAITRFKSLYAILLSSVDSFASDIEPSRSGQNVNGSAESASLLLSTTLSKVLNYSTQSRTLAESSIRSAEESLKAARASHHSAGASFKAASDVKALVEEVVEATKRRDHELKATLDQLGDWITQYERDTQNSRIIVNGEDAEMEGVVQEDMNGSRSGEEDEAQVHAREESHLHQLREQEVLAKQKRLEAEKNIAEVRSLRERMKLEKEESERKRQEAEAEEKERQLRLAEERKRKRQAAEEEKTAIQRRIAELQRKLAEERAKQVEEAEKKRLGEERMRMEEEEEAERHRQRNQEMERQRQQQERQAAEEQVKKDAELRRIAKGRNAAEAERQRLAEEKRMRVEEANHQHRIEQDRLKASHEADLKVKERKEREIKEELKSQKSKSTEPSPQLQRQVQEDVQRESVQAQEAAVGVRPAVEVKVERAKSAQISSEAQSTHPSIAAIKVSPSMSPPAPFARSLSKPRSQGSLSPSKKPLSFNPVSSQTLVPTNIDNTTKAERERLKQRQIASAGGDHPGDPSRTPTYEETRAISLGIRAPHLIQNPTAVAYPPNRSLRVHTDMNVKSSQAESQDVMQQPDSSNSTSSDTPSIHSYDITSTGNLDIKSQYTPVLPEVQSLNIRHIFGTRTFTETSFSETISQPVEVLSAVKPQLPPVQTASRKAEGVQYYNPVMENVPRSFRNRAGEISRSASPVNIRPTRSASPTSPDIGDGGWLNVKTHLAQHPVSVTRQDESHGGRYSYPPSLEDHARTPPLPPPTHAFYPSTSSSYRPDDISGRSPSPREHIGMASQTHKQKRTRERERDDPEDRRRGWAPGERGTRTNRQLPRRRFQASPQTPSPSLPTPSPPHPLAHYTPSVVPAQQYHHYDGSISYPQPQILDGNGGHNEDHLPNRQVISHPLPVNPRNNAHPLNADSNRGGRVLSTGTPSLLSRLADEATESSSQWSARQDSNGNGISGKRGGGGGKRGNTASNRNLSQRIASDNVQSRSPALWERLS